MGNCCLTTETPRQTPHRSETGDSNHDQDYQPEKREPVSPSIPLTDASNSPFLETPEAFELEYPPANQKPGIKVETKWVMDPKLMALLEFFKQMYVRRKDLFQRVISVHREEVLEVLKKTKTHGKAENFNDNVKYLGYTRSFSAGHTREVKLDQDGELKLQRFKVKPIDSGDGGGGGGGGGGGKGGGTTKPGGSK